MGRTWKIAEGRVSLTYHEIASTPEMGRPERNAGFDRNPPFDVAGKLQSFGGRAMRYTFVGALCAALNNVAIILGDFFGVHYTVAAIGSFFVVTPLAYLLHTRFTFRKQGSWHGFIRFAGGVATAFPLFFLCMAIFCSVLGISVIVATPLATVLIYIWNYTSAHWAIRRRQS